MLEHDRSDDLEDKIVAALARRGLVRRPHRPRRLPLVAIAAASLLVGAAGAWSVRFASDPGTAEPHATHLLALYTTGAEPLESAESHRRSIEYAKWARTHSTKELTVVGGAELSGTARVIGKPVETNGKLAGFFLVRAESRAHALALARTSPHLRYGGTIVVHGIVERAGR